MPAHPIWWILFIIGLSFADAYEVVEFDISETKIFSATLVCSPSYRTTDKIECQFNLKNNGQRDYSVLKRRTPLDHFPSDCLNVTRNGVKLPYDGIIVKRSTPAPKEFVLVEAGKTVSQTFDVAEAYDMSTAGSYSIKVDTYLESAVGSVKGMNEPGKPAIPIKITHLSSLPVSFQVVGKEVGNGTLGQRARSFERKNKRILSVGNSQKRSESGCLDPVVHGNDFQKAQTKQLHQVSCQKIKLAISDIGSNGDLYNTWFGTADPGVVSGKFTLMETLLGSDTVTYIFGGENCNQWGILGYTWFGSRTIHLCQNYEYQPDHVGEWSKVTTIIHELGHALAYLEDVVYGVYACKSLAQRAPDSAADNADNYCYFAAYIPQ